MQGYRFCLADPVSAPPGPGYVVSSASQRASHLILVSGLPTSARALGVSGRGRERAQRDPRAASQPPPVLAEKRVVAVVFSQSRPLPSSFPPLALFCFFQLGRGPHVNATAPSHL